MHSFPYLSVPHKLTYLYQFFQVCQGCRMEFFILIFLAFSQLTSALLRQPSDQTSNNIDQLSKGICDGRSMQQSFSLPRSQPSRPEPKNNFPTVGRLNSTLTKNICSARIDPLEWVSCGGALGDAEKIVSVPTIKVYSSFPTQSLGDVHGGNRTDRFRVIV